MSAIVNAWIGLCRGIASLTFPLDMIVCLPSRTTRKPSFPNTRTGLRVIDARQLRHVSDGYLRFFYREQPTFLRLNFEPLANRDLDVLDGFFAGRSLRMATWQRRTTHRPALFGLQELNVIPHGAMLSIPAWHAILSGSCAPASERSGLFNRGASHKHSPNPLPRPIGQMQVQDLNVSIREVIPELDGVLAEDMNSKRPSHRIMFYEIGVVRRESGNFSKTAHQVDLLSAAESS
jgi:hypothetical protein